MKTIKQRFAWDCQAACCAMLTGTTLDDVFAFLGSDGSEHDESSKHPQKVRGIWLQEGCLYLLTRGKFVGLGVQTAEFGPDDGWSTKLSQVLEFDCMVTCASERFEGVPHVVVWDSEARAIRDPNPDKPDERALEDLKLLKEDYLEFLVVYDMDMPERLWRCRLVFE